MNNERQPAQDLLAELREAYRGLPRQIQTRIASLLREAALQQAAAIELVS
jgi:hypothetical protein